MKGLKRDKRSYFLRLFDFIRIICKANRKDTQLVFIMNTLRLFPHKFELLNICTLIIIATLWRGKIKYVVGGGTPLVLYDAKFGNPKIRDFQAQLRKENYTALGLYLLVFAEKILIRTCDEVICIANFYKEIYFSKSEVRLRNLPLAKQFLGANSAVTYDDWIELNKQKAKSKSHITISYIYRSERKGSDIILTALENVTLENIKISTYHNISFEELFRVFSSSDIIVDNTSAEGLGYLGLLALFNGCIVISSYDERYWNYGPFVINICCNDHLSKRESVQFILKQIMKSVDTRHMIFDGDQVENGRIFARILGAHVEAWK